MAYQNVGTPRFYVDLGQFLQATGFWNPPSVFLGLLNLNPSSFVTKSAGEPQFIVPNTSTIRYLAILGHSGGTMYPEWRDDITPNHFGVSNMVKLINAQAYDSEQSVDYSGFSIWTFSDEDAVSATGFKAVIQGGKFGAVSIGNYYDMPNAPNLSLTMSREYGGTKEFTTYNGSSRSNTMWSKPPKWGDLGAWEIDTGELALSRSGRRTWNLKFSYMADGDLWGSNQSLSTILETQINGSDMAPIGISFPADVFVDDCYASSVIVGLTPTEVREQYLEDLNQIISEEGEIAFWTGSAFHSTLNGGVFKEDVLYNIKMTADVSTDLFYTSIGFQYNLLTDDNFFSQVWHKTLGGTLPFIFQANGSDNNPDQFCIAKFKDNSLKATQSAFNVYDISLSIEEVW